MHPTETIGLIHCTFRAWLAACASAVALAQTTTPAGSATPSPNLIPHVDPTFGFELGIPAGWSYDRARFEQPEGAIGLLRGRNPAGAQALQVLVFRDFEVAGFPAWLDGFARRLAEMYGVN